MAVEQDSADMRLTPPMAGPTGGTLVIIIPIVIGIALIVGPNLLLL